MIDRREFVRRIAACATVAPFGAAVALEKNAPKPAAKPLQLLIAGTGDFLAPQIVQAAKRRGHSIKAIERLAKSRVQKLIRDAGAAGETTGEQRWDALIHLPSRSPQQIANVAEEYATKIDRLLLVSSTGVYARLDKVGIDETAPLVTLADPDAPLSDANASGFLARSEATALKAMPDRVCIVRPDLIAGPGDPTDRFTYWPVRVARGGEILAPGKATDYTQVIDVRDLAEFIVLCIERQLVGAFNVASPPGAITMGSLLETCKKVANASGTKQTGSSDARFVWADAGFLSSHRIAAYTDMPVWAPASGGYVGFGRISTAKAAAAGLHCRPLAETVADTLEWFRGEPEDRQKMLKAGLTPKREADALKAWHAAHAAG